MTDVDAARLPLMLATLHLPTIGRHWQSFAARADAEGWGRPLSRRALRARVGRARPAPHRPAPAGVRSAGRQDLRHLRLRRRADGAQGASAGARRADSWIEQGANILCFGPSGTGKSHAAAAIGYALIEQGRRVLFTRTADMVQRLQAARRDLSLPALAKLDRLDCLVLDDLGYARKDQAETAVLFELIAERYERRSLIVTCNQPFSAWEQIFPIRR